MARERLLWGNASEWLNDKYPPIPRFVCACTTALEDHRYAHITARCQELNDIAMTHTSKLTPEQIRDGLSIVAAAVHGQGLNINMVVVGGIVNTMLLHTRQSTTDVDGFFRTKARTVDTSRVLTAATSAACKGLGLQEGWLNDDVALYVQDHALRELYEEALQQNEIVFHASGLTVYAAPWRFSLITKVDRLSKAGARPYDMPDAVAFLGCLIAERGAVPLRREELASWAIEFELPIPSTWVLDALDEAYFIANGVHGLLG
ncbi:unnamed protein product [Peniophora sp. CBMAI 1063]|nr:unnamed protein product [Peniophora sp. CBMAI 1063]